MEAEIGFALAGLAVVVAATVLDRRSGLPAPVLLVVAGLVYALLPGPNIALDPHLILSVILPPLLYAAALNASLLDIRANLRPVLSLSVLLVVATAFAVGGAVAAIVPGLSFAAAIALGAAVAPPDPVASLAIGGRAGLPGRLETLIEGEGLLNDATALTLYQVAVAVAVGSGFSAYSAIGEFALAAVGGVAAGIVVAWLVRQLRRAVDDPLLENAISVATPFLAFLAAEEIHASGVLSVVVAGLILGHQSSVISTGAGRLQTRAVWALVNLLLEGFVFLLIGQQFPAVIRSLDQYPASTIAATTGATVGIVLVLRPLWLFASTSLPGRLLGEKGTHLPGRDLFALSWAGTRGVITLATAFAIPLTTHSGEPFPGRPLILFCAYLVVLVTLVGQGLTFAPLLRRLDLRSEVTEVSELRSAARTAAAHAGLRRLDELSHEESLPLEVVRRLQHEGEDRLRRAEERQRLVARRAADDEDVEGESTVAEVVRFRREMLEAEREELLRWRDAGRLPEAGMRKLERELDHQEGQLPPA